MAKTKSSSALVHCWLLLVKAFQSASKYLYAGIKETGLDDTDFRILEALLHKGPMPVNTIGPKVFLTPGSISVAVDRLLSRGLVRRVESQEDRRIRVVSLTPKGKKLITPVFRKHAAEIRKVFADASPKELRSLEATLKKIGKRAEKLGTGTKPKSRSRLQTDAGCNALRAGRSLATLSHRRRSGRCSNDEKRADLRGVSLVARRGQACSSSGTTRSLSVRDTWTAALRHPEHYWSMTCVTPRSLIIIVGVVSPEPASIAMLLENSPCELNVTI